MTEPVRIKYKNCTEKSRVKAILFHLFTHHDALVVGVQLEYLGEELGASGVHDLLGVARRAEADGGDGLAALQAHGLHLLEKIKMDY